MDSSDSHYVHGTHPLEQERLSRLNSMLNPASLRALDLRPGERVLDVGSGLGQLTRMMARRVGAQGKVVAVERDPQQRSQAIRLARDEGEEFRVDWRAGDAVDLPLGDDEWGGFDVAHTRFLLEHVTDPEAVVRAMVRAAKPGGRVVLEDDDHEVLRLSPDEPEVLALWRAYYLTYERQGKDPYVGRRLVSLLHGAGARPRVSRCLHFGSCAGSPEFESMIENFIGIIDGARAEMVHFGLAGEGDIDGGIEAFRRWMRRPDAAMWYTTCWAEGVRPAKGANEAANRTNPSAPVARGSSGTDFPAPGATEGVQDEASMLRFLMNAANDLSSTLELDQVFHRIARGIRPLIDYHLFCIMLWNEQTQMLEHSFSMKYGEAIPQRGGFPLGYGLSGSAARLRRPIRVSNVLNDPRYVRFRHPEVEILSELAVPLVFQDQLIGVLDLESTRLDYFTEQHEQVVSALASHIATAIANARLFEQSRRHERRMKLELATAREIQRGLLPQTVPPAEDLEVGSAYTPAAQLGGDFYDFLRCPDGRLAFAVGDVAGKATPAALLASLAVGLLRGHVVERPYEPDEMLADLNGHLLSSTADNRFVAMTYGLFDDRSRTIRLANAGLPHARLARGVGLKTVEAGGMPLGLWPGTTYETLEMRVAPGDVLVLCSDGLMEARDDRGQVFESTRMASAIDELVGQSAEQIASGLNQLAIGFAGGEARQEDDYTTIVLKFL
jgi:serine phosphatase RsbU (regulator of sigma subunit)/ubiquinone/menaquinone biosynthesis C-methylase UbiE